MTSSRQTESHDYIVVGAGSSGAVIASRLSEDRDASVLLLEAGGPGGNPLLSMPLAFKSMYNNPAHSWGYTSEPEPGLNGRSLDIPRGKMLGGSSTVNALICVRGNRRDYDLIAEQGNEGWGFADILPYFRKLESNWRGETALHGGDGPIRVSLIDHPDMLFGPLRQAAGAVGIAYSDDVNGAVQDGISRMEATIGGGLRQSTARAYLHPARRRANLTIRTRAPANRVLIENGRAIGVEYSAGGEIRRAHANREIIVSAGAYNSPQLLMLSGIGPADDLVRHGIAPVLDLPGVGRNLGEHPNFIMLFKARGKVGLTKYLRADRAAVEIARWFLRRDGIFASNGAAAHVFLRTESGLERPDLQLVCMSLDHGADLWFPGLTRKPIHGFSVRIGALHPVSRGRVDLRSADPRAKPRIRFNMFDDPADLDTMIRGLEMTREIYNAAPMRDLIEMEISPGHGLKGRDLVPVLRQHAGHRSHPVGTCRMGQGPDSVVDSRLRVHNIAGLRVADASILPELPSGNTNIPCIMIGEKAADMIAGGTGAERHGDQSIRK